MIITGSTAIRMVSNHAIIQAVPELIEVVEKYAAADRRYQPKKNCPDCDRLSYFTGIEEEALQAISNLPSDAVQRLKVFLGDTEIYVNVPQPGRPSSLKQLN